MTSSGPPLLRFIDGAADRTRGDASARGGEPVVVELDSAWSPASPADRTIAVRPLARRALARHDALGEALTLSDRFAAEAGLDEALLVDDVALWPRRRLVVWRRLHDLVLWRAILAELGVDGSSRVDEAIDEPVALRDLLVALGVRGAAPSPPPPAAPPARRTAPARPSPISRVLGRARRLVGATAPRPAPPAASAAAAAERERAGRLIDGRRLLVLTDSSVHQTVDLPDGPARLDAFLGPIVERLRQTSLDPVVVDLDPAAAERTPASGAASHPGGPIVGGRAITGAPDAPGDAARAAALAETVTARLRDATASLDLDGVDVGGTLLDGERRYAAASLGAWLRTRTRIERFLAARRPAGILMINEYSRPEWLAAARRTGVPVAAVQHGIIHRHHAGYVLPHRAPGTLLPDRTYVFGEAERRLLTSGIYRDDEVRVGGAPRLDFLARGDAAVGANRRAVRDATRSMLGARPGERLVVFSSTSNADIRRLVVAPALEAIIDRALPGVRLVVKLHPGEPAHDGYERLVVGLAAAGGFAPPPVSVVRDIDLFRLLRAADAHLGIHSTVLTDAVVAGVPNLIVVGFPGCDLLGYVDRGVARPVREGGEFLAALDGLAAPEAVDEAAREAFLADQFAAGDASERIASDLERWLT